MNIQTRGFADMSVFENDWLKMQERKKERNRQTETNGMANEFVWRVCTDEI